MDTEMGQAGAIFYVNGDARIQHPLSLDDVSFRPVVLCTGYDIIEIYHKSNHVRHRPHHRRWSEWKGGM
jgi:hypothetical protein